jgi:PAS domain S-box-containing protein
MSRRPQRSRTQKTSTGDAPAADTEPAHRSSRKVAAASQSPADPHVPLHPQAAGEARRYRALAEVAGQVLWMATADGELAGDLTSWCAFTGQSEGEARGHGWTAAIHPDDRAATLAAWSEAVTSHRRYVHEHRIRRRNGIYCDMLVRGVPILTDDAPAQVQEWVGICIDITERKRLERRTGEALAALLEMAEVMVSPTLAEALTESASRAPKERKERPEDKNPSSTIRTLVALCCRVLGSERVAFVLLDPATEVLRDALLLGASPEQEARWGQRLRGLKLEDRFDEETCARIRSGEAVLVQVDRLPIADPASILSSHYFLLAPMLVSGRFAGYLGVNFGDGPHDYPAESVSLTQAVAHLIGIVIERERLLAEREKVRGHALALQEANRRMDEFLGIAGHEMGTPLTVLKSQLQLFARGLRLSESSVAPSGKSASLSAEASTSTSRPVAMVRDRQAHLLARMQHQVTRLERLIGDLLDASRLESGKLELQLADEDPLALVREIVEEQRISNPERTIHLEQSPDAGARWLTRLDRDRIGQVLTNYLSNALKYSSTDRPVTVRIETPAGQLRVSVHDEGPGIAPERQPEIWGRFQRLPEIQVQSGSGVGLGLGLYISREIVEQHGGRVGVESVPGKGSTFWFTLPSAQSSG